MRYRAEDKSKVVARLNSNTQSIGLQFVCDCSTLEEIIITEVLTAKQFEITTSVAEFFFNKKYADVKDNRIQTIDCLCYNCLYICIASYVVPM